MRLDSRDGRPRDPLCPWVTVTLDGEVVHLCEWVDTDTGEVGFIESHKVAGQRLATYDGNGIKRVTRKGDVRVTLKPDAPEDMRAEYLRRALR